MTTFLFTVGWAAGSIAAFWLFREAALNDFKRVTVLGALLMGAYSVVLPPLALLTALCLYLMSDGSSSSGLNRTLWTREDA